MCSDQPETAHDRRRYPRVKAEIPVELLPTGTEIPLLVAIDEISLCGCYVPAMFTMEVGTTLDLTLSLPDRRIRASAVVVTKFPNLGNGIDFIDMDPQDRLILHEYIASL
jgi:hypothetical protein